MEQKAAAIRGYSRLGKILSERDMTVADLGRLLDRRRVRVNPKTLYRLGDPTAAIERLDMAVAGEICKALTIDLSTLVSFETVRPGLHKLSPARQRRLDVLLDRQSEGKLSGREQSELVDLVEEAERLTLQNARLLSRARHATLRT
jgi:hypothetical protein